MHDSFSLFEKIILKKEGIFAFEKKLIIIQKVI